MSKPTYVAIYVCDGCGQEISPPEPNAFTFNYGTMLDGTKHCYPCCAKLDRDTMIADGKITLYLTSRPIHNGEVGMINRYERNWFVTNWPSSLEFRVTSGPSRSWHNIARVRYDVWFHGPDGHVWHGIQYGDNTQLCHCKRTKLWRKA